MTLLRFDVDARRALVAADGAWAPLADALTAELMPLLERPLPIPERKAELTRGGGRCPTHGTLLEFDPWRPHDHHCPRCGVDYQDPRHDAWWAMGAQLWLAERAVHAAAVGLLREDDRCRTLSATILGALADRYASYPNRDNALGPSRPFFSTYLESIWLLNVCHALALLEEGDDAATHARLGRHVRQRLIHPSSTLVASFHEGLSNRQVWNEVAVLSALTLLGEELEVTHRLDNEDGLIGLLERGLLPDGSWYEGENYHLFAHRGLWYGVELLRASGDDDDTPLDEVLDRRYRRGFLAPFAGVLPDDTLPSRRDSQYAVSIRQWRLAEYLELGRSHAEDPDIDGLLARLYDGTGDAASARRERSHSTADAERNVAAGRLDRASLSWRALLMASPSPVGARGWRPTSRCLAHQGLAVLRRDAGRDYIALEGGHHGGGHGHPDRLALTLQRDGARFLQDPGTGSYVERTLHWYRSTLAHHAPLVNGRSQQSGTTVLEAFEERGGAGWISKRTVEQSSGLELRRTVVAGDGYLVDLLEWSPAGGAATAASTVAKSASTSEPTITLPIAAQVGTLRVENAEIGASAWSATERAGAGGLEDGFDFARELRAVVIGERQLDFEAIPEHPRSVATDNAEDEASVQRARVSYRSSRGATLVAATVPGPPGHGESPWHWLEVTASSGRIVGVWSWGPAGQGATTQITPENVGALVRVTTADGTTATHGLTDTGWRIALAVNGASSSVDLDRAVHLPLADMPTEADDAADSDATNEASRGDDVAEPVPIDFEVPWLEEESGDVGELIDDALYLPLGEAHYVRTDESWRDAGEPTATLQLWCTDAELVADLEVLTGAPVVPEAGADNPFDNERADVNADGVQWYVRHPDAADWGAAGLIVPGTGAGGIRAHRLAGDDRAAPRVEWRDVDGGWAMRLRWSLQTLPIADDGCLAFDLLVNERPADRQRRRGQLALSGGARFGYLAGDRHRPDAALLLALPIATT